MGKLIVEVINETALSLKDDIKEDVYKGFCARKKISRHKAHYCYQSTEGSEYINIRLYYRPLQFNISDAVFYACIDAGTGWRIGSIGNELIDVIVDRSKLVSSSCITLTLKNKNI